MSVNPPSSDIPISSGGEIPQPPQRSIPSSYLPHVCSVVSHDSTTATRVGKVAVDVAAIAGQDIHQTSPTTVRKAQHTYDKHPEDKVRGKDSEAVTGALRDIASRHSGEGSSGGVLRPAVGSSTLQQPIMQEQEESSHPEHSQELEQEGASEEVPVDEPPVGEEVEEEMEEEGESLGSMMSSDPVSVGSTGSESIIEAAATGRPTASPATGERLEPEAIVTGNLAQAVTGDQLSEEKASVMRPILKRVGERIHLSASSDETCFEANKCALTLTANLKELGLQDSDIAIAERIVGELKKNEGIFGNDEYGIAVRDGHVTHTPGALTDANIAALPERVREQVQRAKDEGKTKEITQEEYQRQLREGSKWIKSFCAEFSNAIKEFDRKEAEKQKEKEKIAAESQSSKHRAVYAAQTQQNAVSQDIEGAEVRAEIRIEDRNAEQQIQLLRKKLIEVLEKKIAKKQKDEDALKRKEDEKRETGEKISKEEQ